MIHEYIFREPCRDLYTVITPGGSMRKAKQRSEAEVAPPSRRTGQSTVALYYMRLHVTPFGQQNISSLCVGTDWGGFVVELFGPM